MLLSPRRNGLDSLSKDREQTRHMRKKSHKISEKPLDGRAVRFSKANDRKSLGHWPVDPCLSCRVCQEHPAGVPGNFIKFMCLFLSLSKEVRVFKGGGSPNGRHDAIGPPVLLPSHRVGTGKPVFGGALPAIDAVSRHDREEPYAPQG